MTDTPFNAPGNISVTFKSDEPGGKFNDPKSPGTWIVVHGTVGQVREQVIEIFELDPKESLNLPLYALVNEATKLFKGVSAVGQILGGKVLNDGKGSVGKPDGDVWSQVNNAAQAAQKKEDEDPILAALEAAKTVAEVQQIWAENQALFNSNAEYMTAYKARGKALS